QRLAVEHACRATQRLADKRERRAPRDRVSARKQHHRAMFALLDAAKELVAHARLADPRRPDEQCAARHGFRQHLVEDAAEHRELALASDARRGLTEELARLDPDPALRDERAALRTAAHLEALVEERGRRLVDRDAPGAYGALVDERRIGGGRSAFDRIA